jgi:dihydrofolate synthase/folylpolyglutamate synthase
MLNVRTGKEAAFVTDLGGQYQARNLPGIFTAIESLQNLGINIGEHAIAQGLKAVKKSTGLKGRWQLLRESPVVLCDTAHNADGVGEVMRQLMALKMRCIHIIWGMVKGKDHGQILSLLPKSATYYFCEASIPRALPAEELALMAGRHGLEGSVLPDVNEALKAALTRANADDVVFIGGSTFVVADIDDL